ncbi:hypothetical protein PENSPDRAFT_490292 [Peniophora sp. CONT]|nr:hypothetical protein PENSPDRAFT_490292 [Peniophora sp. CONT]
MNHECFDYIRCECILWAVKETKRKRIGGHRTKWTGMGESFRGDDCGPTTEITCALYATHSDRQRMAGECPFFGSTTEGAGLKELRARAMHTPLYVYASSLWRRTQGREKTFEKICHKVAKARTAYTYSPKLGVCKYVRGPIRPYTPLGLGTIVVRPVTVSSQSGVEAKDTLHRRLQHFGGQRT